MREQWVYFFCGWSPKLNQWPYILHLSRDQCGIQPTAKKQIFLNPNALCVSLYLLSIDQHLQCKFWPRKPLSIAGLLSSLAPAASSSVILAQFVKSGMWRICGTCERLCVTRCQDDHCARWWNAFHHKSSIDRLFPASFARRNSDCDQLLFHWNSALHWGLENLSQAIDRSKGNWIRDQVPTYSKPSTTTLSSVPLLGDFWPFKGKVRKELQKGVLWLILFW